MKKLILLSAFLMALVMQSYGQLSISATAIDPLCFNEQGQINITGSGGSAPYSYAVNGGAYQTGGNFSEFSGTYTVFVQDATLAVSSTVVLINNPAPVSSNVASIINPTCGQACAGTIVFSNTGGTGSISMNPSPTNLCAGSYTFTATDGNGCTATTNAALNNVSPLIVTATNTLQTCQNSNDATLTIQVLGGLAPYNFNVNGWLTANSGTNSATFINLPANSYYISVTDANGCNSNINTQIFMSSNAVVINNISISSYTNCANPTATAICLASGAGTLLYSTTGGIPSTSNVITGLQNGYTSVIATNGTCTDSSIVTVLPLQQFPPYVQNTCVGANNGAANVAVAFGMPPYTCNFAGTPNFGGNNLAAGVYTYSVTDGAGCVLMDSVTIDTVSLQTNIVPTYFPNGCLEKIEVVAVNQTSVSTTWNTLSGQLISYNNFIYAHYISDTVITLITSTGACFDSDTFHLNPTTFVGAISNFNYPPNCSQQFNSIKVIHALYDAPYTYSWSGPSISGQGTDSIYNLLPNDYYMSYVTNAHGCTDSQFTYTQTGNYNSNLWNINDDTICKGETKLFNFNSNFYSGYNVDVSNANGTVASVNLNLLGVSLSPTVTTTYTAFLNDPNACINTDTFTVYVKNTYFTSALNITDASCSNATDGSLIVVNTPSIPNAQYLWIDSSTNFDLQNVGQGNYWVKITDSISGCQVITGHVGVQANSCADVSGYVYWDMNTNCTKDATEPTVKNALIALVNANGDTIKQLTTQNGFYQFSSLQYGTYSIVQIKNYISTTACGNVTTISLSASNNNVVHNFADSLPQFDHLSGVQSGTACIVPANTNQVKKLFVFVNNPQLAGTGSAATYWVKNTNFTIQSIVPAASYTSTNGDTLFWTLQDLPNNFATIIYTVPPTLVNGLFLNNHYGLENVAALDNNLTNNFGNLYINTCASYDPNDKDVMPKGPINNGYITMADNSLLYTIRFQNTGNAAAVNIVVKDTIDANLNINSIEMIMASHAYNVKIEGRVITFTFPQIMLPESSFDEPNSHGIFIFKIKQNAGNGPGTLMLNKAEIYFDYNAPITTNTTFSKIFDSLENASIQVLPTASCNSTQGNGKVNWTINGGLPPFQFAVTPAISGLQYSGNSIQNFTQGVYTVMATDAIGQTLSTVVNVGKSSPLSLGTNVVMPSSTSTGLISVFGVGGIAPYSYLWNPTGATTAAITNLLDTTYSVTVTDGGGCTISAQFVIATVTGIQTIEKSSIKLYPNPALDVLWLEASTALGTIEVISVEGRLVATKNFESAINGNIYVANFAPGQYFIKNNKGKLIGKFIVQKN